jgi:hypothetical protein
MTAPLEGAVLVSLSLSTVGRAMNPLLRPSLCTLGVCVCVCVCAGACGEGGLDLLCVIGLGCLDSFTFLRKH